MHAGATDATDRPRRSTRRRWPAPGRRPVPRRPTCAAYCVASTPMPGSFAPPPRDSMKTIKVDYLARVEGEGAVRIRFRGDQVRDVAVRIFEPPRFFEAFLRGRSWTEVTDITARICGICPVAYQMSSVRAMERICGIEVDGQLRALRRLLYCGEWMESDALHVYMIHLPDFL